MDNLKPHKLALLFPEMQGDEFKQLVADIKTGGLIEPVWVYEGQVLDGWHRYRAALAAGKEPKTREWRGKDPMAFVVSMNIMRRHLNESQRAMLLVQAADQAGRLEPHGGQGGEGSAGAASPSADLAKQINVSERTVTRARRVLDKPEMAHKVIAGNLSLNEADRRMRPKPKRSPEADWKQSGEVKELLDFVRAWRESLPDAIRMVKAGKLSPEAKRFLAARVRPMADMLGKFADWLEA